MKTETWTYRDPVEDFSGYLAICGDGRPLAAGGLRVQRGLTLDAIRDLAEIMNGKQRALQICCDGAKCGIDYDPDGSGKRRALGRFLRFLKPLLAQRLSLGPDMGVEFSELEELAHAEGISSVKLAAGLAQGMSENELLARMRTLAEPAGALSVGQRRAGHGLAHAALGAWGAAFSGRPLTAAIQGFGTLGRSAALSLQEAGVRVVAVSDEHRCLEAPRRLPVTELLSAPPRTLGATVPKGARICMPSHVFGVTADVLVLAACENAIPCSAASHIKSRLVVAGANGALSRPVEDELYQRDHLVLPDIIAGSGGSASVDALLAPSSRPDARSVLMLTAQTTRRLAETAVAAAAADGSTLGEAAAALSQRAPVKSGETPYRLRLISETRRKESNVIAEALNVA